MTSVKVRKRDGGVEAWDGAKIARAVERAAAACGQQRGAAAAAVVDRVTQRVESRGHDAVSVDDVHDEVVVALRQLGAREVADAYARYRDRHASMRAVKIDEGAIAEYVRASKYCRHVHGESRRESWAETVSRVRDMHLASLDEDGLAATPIHLPEVGATTVGRATRWAFDVCVLERGIVMPSARSLQFAGEKIRRHNPAMYNCSSAACATPDFFHDLLYLLLCGCGVGVSVQRSHVDALPALIKPSRRVRHETIADSIEGWADALDSLMRGYWIDGHGEYVEFDYSEIRPEGSPLRVSGGVAPGHIGLKQALEQVREIMDRCARAGRLRPIDCMHIDCVVAQCVVSGGVRRASLWHGFDADDWECATAKTEDWMRRAPWLAMSNNSAYVLPETTRGQVDRALEASRAWGDPGLYFARSRDYVPNPCVEIGMRPFDDETGRFGFSFCNLTERVMRANLCHSEALRGAVAASLIGTLQARFSDFSRMRTRSASENIAERDRLIGVSMTGMVDAPSLSFDERALASAAAAVVATNEVVAEAVGIRPAARCTCVKPSGTLSLAVKPGPVGSGIHPHPAKRYIRRIVANCNEAPFRALRAVNPQACHRKTDPQTGQPHPTDWIISFPVETSAETADEVGAIGQMERALLVQRCWVLPGTTRDLPLTHSVSLTVLVNPDEWSDVADWLWNAWRASLRGQEASLAAVSLFPDHGAFSHPDAPREPVTLATEAHWIALAREWKPVDYSRLRESEDSVVGMDPACEGQKCEVQP